MPFGYIESSLLADDLWSLCPFTACWIESNDIESAFIQPTVEDVLYRQRPQISRDRVQSLEFIAPLISHENPSY